MNKKTKSKNRGSLERSLKRKRVAKQRLILTFFIISIIGLFGNIFYIKYVHGDDLERMAIRQQVNHRGVDRAINPNRGSILDRNGQVLATSSTVFNIILDVRVLVQSDQNNEEPINQIETVEIINRILGIEEEVLWDYLAKDEDGNLVRDTHYLPIKTQVPRSLANELMAENPVGVWLEEDTLRLYPNSDAASQVIGFVHGDNNNWGLELFYNSELSGTPGRTVRMFDEHGNAFLNQISPNQGYSLVTTIDLSMQQFAVEAAEKYGSMHNAERASVIIMNPNTGEILAMAQYPTFDNSEPFNIDLINSEPSRNQINNTEKEDQLTEFFKIWSNYNVSSSFEPGSTFKPLVAAYAVENNIISKNETFYCNGSITIADTTINCWNRSGHGHMTLSKSIAVSCNVSIITIASRMGRDNFFEFMQDFGVGEYTQIDLPGEFSAAPLVYTLEQLNPVELATSSMGQGFNMTAIQLITSFSSVINGGNLMRPYVVSQIVDSNGNVVEETAPKIQRRVLSQEVSDFFREEMVDVFSDSGTGANARIEGYKIGGKTGTAQRGARDGSEYTLSFIGYLPADNPEYVVLTIIDNPSPFIQGVTSPAPMLRDVMINIIQHTSMPPYDPNAIIDFGDDTILVDNYVGRSLLDVTRILNSQNLNFDVIGSGTVIHMQQPEPGSRISPSGRVFLYVTEETDVPLTLIPNVEGLPVFEAKEAIKNSNLVPIVIERPLIIDDTILENSENLAIFEESTNGKIVRDQMPTAGIRVGEGTEITLIVR